LVLEALGVDDLRRLVRAFRAGTGAAVTVPVV
jgi:hypothetical protein